MVTADAPRRVIVTGGLGFIGSNLSRLLEGPGAEVTVWDLPTTPVPVDFPDNVEIRGLDLRAPLTSADVEGADAIFHLAGNASGAISLERPRFDFEANVAAAFNVAVAALDAGVRRFVFMSSALVYGVPTATPIPETHPTIPLLPYAGSKLAAENVMMGLWHGLGLPVVIGRCFAVYGRGENPKTAEAEPGVFARAWLRNEPIVVLGDLDRKTRDFVHVIDVARALVLLATQAEPGSVVNIGSGTEVSLRQLLETLAAVVGDEPRFEMSDHYWNDSFRHVADISKLRSLGYSPQISLEVGIEGLLRDESQGRSIS